MTDQPEAACPNATWAGLSWCATCPTPEPGKSCARQPDELLRAATEQPDPSDLTGYIAPEPAIRCLTVATAGQPTTQEQTLKPTLGEQVTTLFARLADLNDQVAALRNPEWGARMGLLPKGHPLCPEQPDANTAVEVRDPCPRCESSSDRIPRRLMADHLRDTHPEEQQP